jgi:quinone-modifying oxidoreductase subunit QmoC
MAKVDLKFGKKLKKFGAIDFNACYNCGTCTAVCALSDEKDSFPREMVRFSVTGLSEDVKGSLKPWLCYYCGECTTYCPQEAKPGELMMSLRRYATSRYDWTGLSGLLYKNLLAYIIAFLLVIAGVIGAYMSDTFTTEEWFHYGHYFEMFAIVGVFLLILTPNIFRMWLYSVQSKKKGFKLKHYFSAFGELLVHMFTQKRTLKCDDDAKNKIWWFEHFILVFGYLALLFTTVVLDWFATEVPFIIYMGYVFSGIIFIVTFDFVIRRIRKRSEKSTFSHPSDWFFVIWLFLMGVSAFAVRLLVDTGLVLDNFWVYLFHIIILVQWALIIVPFGKWTHFLYRSFAMYFDKVNKLNAA